LLQQSDIGNSSLNNNNTNGNILIRGNNFVRTRTT
jgi:hypothetical protein